MLRLILQLTLQNIFDKRALCLFFVDIHKNTSILAAIFSLLLSRGQMSDYYVNRESGNMINLNHPLFTITAIHIFFNMCH